MVHISRHLLGYKHIGGAAFWSLCSTLASRLTGITASIIAARTLGKIAFGQFGIVQNTVIMFSVFTTLGITLTASRYIADFSINAPHRVRSIMFLSQLLAASSGSVGCIALIALAQYIAGPVLKSPDLSAAIRWSSISVLASTINAAQIGILLGLQQYKKIAVLNTYVAAATIPLCLLGFYLGTTTSFVVLIGAIQVVGVIVFQGSLNQTIDRYGQRPSFREATREISTLFHYGLPATLTNMLAAPVTWAAFAILARRDAGFKEVALINAITPWRYILSLASSNVSQVILPMMAGKSSDNEKVDFAMRTVRLNLIITLPLLIAILLSCYPILRMYGSDFVDGWRAFVLIQMAAFIQAVQGPLIKYLECTDRLWVNFMMNIVWSGIVIGGTYYLSDLGAIGYAVSQVVAFIVFGVIIAIMINSYRKASYAIGT